MPFQLVLSLFPGIGLLDRAFEEEGFCVVRGPDVLWGGDVNRFNPSVGKFDGIIGGPPCQAFSSLAYLNRSKGHEPKFGNLIPEFERVVFEAEPEWFIMENVPAAPEPEVDGYVVQSFTMVDSECGGMTSRKRTISFGAADWSDRPVLQFDLRLCGGGEALAVTGNARAMSVGGTIRRRENGNDKEGYSSRLPLSEMIRLQGAPDDIFGEHCPFTETAKRQMIGNGVPLPMGRAIARAVKQAVDEQ
jgi:DNA (cytosine-5)-methyltransferase 1